MHKAQSIYTADPAVLDISKLNRIYYMTRNGVFNAKRDSQMIRYIFHVIKVAVHICKHASDHRLKRLQKGLTGFVAGLFFSPSICFPENVKEGINN